MVEAHLTGDKSTDSESITPLHPVTKLSIIDEELNRHGMGRYHWLIWAVCSTGFMIDFMWTQANTLTLPSIQRELGFSDKQLANIATVYAAGMIIGAFSWGTLVDIVGRRAAFYGTSLISGVFGICIGVMPSFIGLQAMALFVGFGTGGSIPVDSTVTAEYLPNGRSYLLTALAIFAQLGSVASTLIAYGFIPNYSCSTDLRSCRLTKGIQPCCSRESNMGWRYVFFTIGSITFGVFILRFFIFPFYESPKFLALKGNDRGAVEVIRKVSAFNKHPCDFTVESLQERCQESPVAEKVALSKQLTGEISRLKGLFGSWKMTRITIIVWLIWIFSYGSVNVANTYLPTILQRKNIAAHVGLNQTYIDYLIINTPGIAGAVTSVLMVRVPLLGRKWTLIFASAMMSLSLFLYTVVNTQAGHVGFNVMLVFFQLVFSAALWGWTPEAFPTAVRGTATGFAMVLAVTSGMVAPQIAAQLFTGPNGSNVVLYVPAAGLLLCTVAVLCVPLKDMVVSRDI